MAEWIRANDTLLWVLATASVVTFVATLIAVPWIVIRIPHDYFAHRTRHATDWSQHHPAVRVLLKAGKNTLGAVFVLVGLAMLALPGQGLLTMLIGVMLLDFPGKFRFERWFVGRRPVLRAMNWLRKKGGRPPLTLHEDDAAPT
jgi:hypothetical protein